MLTLIIGYGNPLRGDDGLGQAAAEILQEADLAPCQIIAAHQLLPEFCQLISQAERLIFIDAAYDPQSGVGAISLKRLNTENFNEIMPPPYGHHVTPTALLAQAAALYGYAPPAYLLTVNGQNFEIGAGLSEAVWASLPKLIEAIKALVSNCDLSLNGLA